MPVDADLRQSRESVVRTEKFPRKQKTLQERAQFKLHDPAGAEALAISPDGRTIVAGSNSGWIQVWRAASQEEVRDAGW